MTTNHRYWIGSAAYVGLDGYSDATRMSTIDALRIHAAEHGDNALVATCRRAESGDTRARETVQRILDESYIAEE